MILADVVDTKELLETIVASIVAGLGVTFIFSLAIHGATRYADYTRDEKPLAAAGFAVLGVVSFLVTIAMVVIGIIVMTSK